MVQLVNKKQSQQITMSKSSESIMINATNNNEVENWKAQKHTHQNYLMKS